MGNDEWIHLGALCGKLYFIWISRRGRFLLDIIYIYKRKKTGKVRFKYAFDLGRKKNKNIKLLLMNAYIVMPLIIFFVGGFMFYTQLKVFGQLTSWVEHKEKTEIVEYRIGDSKRTRGRYGFKLKTETGELYKFWLLSSNVYIASNINIEDATHAEMESSIGPLGRDVDKVFLFNNNSDTH